MLLGVTGSIAAYKTAWLVRDPVKAGAEVQVVATPAAHDFVTPLTLATLSKRPVLTDLFLRTAPEAGTTTCRWVAGPTCSWWLLPAPIPLAKMAQGSVTTCCWPSGSVPPVRCVRGPAMDLEMFADPATAHNLDLLRQRGVHTIGP